MTTTMTARFPGKCTSCGGQISVGATILWAKGEGARHADCGATSSAARPAKRTHTEIINGKRVEVAGSLLAMHRADERADRRAREGFDARYARNPDMY